MVQNLLKWCEIHAKREKFRLFYYKIYYICYHYFFISLQLRYLYSALFHSYLVFWTIFSNLCLFCLALFIFRHPIYFKDLIYTLFLFMLFIFNYVIYILLYLIYIQCFYLYTASFTFSQFFYCSWKKIY